MEVTMKNSTRINKKTTCKIDWINYRKTKKLIIEMPQNSKSSNSKDPEEVMLKAWNYNPDSGRVQLNP